MSYAKQIPEPQVDLETIKAKSPTCPGLFYGSAAQDGILTRIRIVGGILNLQQCEAITKISDRYGDGYLQVTNRANLQIRGLHTAIAPASLRDFQELGLASQATEIDPIRNIMASPTAGIDPHALIDTRPLVKTWDNYLQSHLELAALSPKFSVCFDGGELIAVGGLRNDITLAAERILDDSEAPKIMLRLYLNAVSDSLQDASRRPVIKDVRITDIVILPDQAVELLAALAQVYLDYICENVASDSHRKPRLRQVLSDWEIETYLERVQQLLSFPLNRVEASQKHPISESYPHLGVHAQSHSGFYYLGISLPLGRIATNQLRSLANLAQTHGSGELRLTPWQNLLITDIPKHQLSVLEAEVAKLGFHTSANHFGSAIVACAGLSGCKSSATHTQAHALEMIRTLADQVKLARPVNIHFTGCTKSCAQHSPSDIALVGTLIPEGEAYDIYVGSPDRNTNSSFGRKIVRSVPIEHLNAIMENMVRVYQERTSDPSQSFKDFVDRYSIPQLQQCFDLELRRLL